MNEWDGHSFFYRMNESVNEGRMYRQIGMSKEWRWCFQCRKILGIRDARLKKWPSLNSGHQGTAIRIMPTKGQRSGNERLYESWVSPSVEVCSLIMRYVMSMEMVWMNMDFQDRNDKQTTLYFTFTRKAQCLKVIFYNFTIVISLECYFYALPVNLSTENRIYRFFTIFCWMFSYTYSLWLESKICRDIAMIVS